MLLPNQELVSMDDLYGGTFRYFTKIAVPHGLSLKLVDFTIPGALESSITDKTKMIWIETPTNPNLKIVDIRHVVDIAKKHNILVVVDNTFSSPYFQRPLELGADLVLHSVTKYLNGHCDVVAGVVVGRDDGLREQLQFIQNGCGAVPSPFDTFVALRGLKTLHLRMKRHEENAIQIAQFLSKSDKVEKIYYPGLPSHPQHHIAKKQMHGFGGMITFWLKGGITESRQFLENLHLFSLAESLGGVESLANHPAIMTHASIPLEKRNSLGIHDNMIRLSCGIEDVEDLLEDITNALNHIQK